MIPTEVTPTQDYITGAGFSFQNSDTRLVDLSGSGSIQFTDVQETTAITVRQLRTATFGIFSNATNGFTATTVQAAIEEARNSPAVNFISIASATAIASSTDTTIAGLTYTNSTGAAIKMVAEFSGDITISTTGGVLSASIYLNGSQVANSLRKTAGDQGALAGAARVTAFTSCKVTVPNGQTIDVRASVSAGSISIAACGFQLTKCGDF